jgi:epoxyqueuosine reductase
LSSKEVYDKKQIRTAAAECGFELCGFASAAPVAEVSIYQNWVASGFAGEMRYLTDYRAEVRSDPRRLLPAAQTIICLGKVYNWPTPEAALISRYAWGDDYHDAMRSGMTRLVERLRESGDFEWKLCVDTAPLLERSYARLAGLGWIGRNTCLINQQLGSWVFLGEILVSFELEPDGPPPDRCGTCRRCIDACPTEAIVPLGESFTVDSRLCISYLTIESRGAMPEDRREGVGGHVFGCDICQDVCPWNRRAAVTEDARFAPRHPDTDLAALAGISEDEFRQRFRGTPVTRARYSGFLRNVAVAMGNSGRQELLPALRKLASSEDAMVAEHARWAIAKLYWHSLQ